MLLTWIRRTRAAAGDSWVLAEVPLGEEREEYELEVLDGGTVVRTVAGLASPAFTYTTAMATADFGGPVTSLRLPRLPDRRARPRGAGRGDRRQA